MVLATEVEEQSTFHVKINIKAQEKITKMKSWNEDICNFELAPGSWPEGPNAGGENPPPPLEFELLCNILNWFTTQLLMYK